MKAITRFFSRAHWSDTDNVATATKVVVVARQHYQEFSRTYQASIADVFRIVRNELKVLSASHNKVVWTLFRLTDGRYRVLFAVVSLQQHIIPTGISVVVPETWLLYRVLRPATIYKVEASQPYWAYLSQSGELNVTPAAGIMQQPRIFADALGVTLGTDAVASFSPRVWFAQQPLPLSLKELPGLIVWHTPATEREKLNYRQLAALTGAMAVGYMMLLSGWLVFHSNRLQQQVAELQSQANSLFEQQQKLSQKADVIDQYQAVLLRFPFSSDLLARLAGQIGDIATINNLQLSGNLLKISGIATSATEVISRLTTSQDWKEVRFDNNIQKVKDEERFSISMVFSPSTPEVKP